eukprot:TRINITY_DN37368_c0_g1_i1.p1 TRINITY_DN37368_c0_g1~~TRINITY_DN37368_c0_g1_i1.p1  ORF type:complete len:692 (-),score=217.09 TRINITY_DN37368_c0_g1_i1:211-2286(-)
MAARAAEVPLSRSRSPPAKRAKEGKDAEKHKSKDKADGKATREREREREKERERSRSRERRRRKDEDDREQRKRSEPEVKQKAEKEKKAKRSKESRERAEGKESKKEGKDSKKESKESAAEANEPKKEAQVSAESQERKAAGVKEDPKAQGSKEEAASAQPAQAEYPPGTQFITPEQARVEVARLGALGQPTAQWLVQAAWGAGSTPTPVPPGVVIGAVGPSPEESAKQAAAAAARKDALAKARRAAPPPPWMAAAAVFKPAKASASGSTATAAESSSSAAAPAGGEAAGAPKKKLDMADLSLLQRAIAEERNKLQMFVVKARQDYDERKESGKERSHTDAQEYFQATVGEVLGPESGPQFRVEATIGRGVFSSVFHCKGVKDGKDFAIKFIRKNAMMRKAAEKEVELYKRLAKDGHGEDPEGSRHIIFLAGANFEHSGHLCMVFELMRCDMRFALQKYGQGGGLPLPTLAQYARQMFLALRALRRLKVIHADLKPDNLLMTMNKAEIQLCDFGAGFHVSEQVKTAYLQPRYYRAPEIMIGLPYDTQIDLWSAGTTVFELATGRILFTGRSNNQMMRQMIDVCGGFLARFTVDGEFSKKHFNDAGEFLHRDPESITGEPTPTPARLPRPRRSAAAILQATLTTPSAGVERTTHDKWVSQLGELVDQCLRTDPLERIQPEQALELPFFRKDG